MLLRTEDDLDRWRREHRSLKVLHALDRAGLFALIADGLARPIAELASEMGVDARALRIMAQMMAARGVVVIDGDSIAIAPLMTRNPAWLAGLRVERDGVALEADMHAVLTSGKPLRRTQGGVTSDPAAAEVFLRGLHRRSAFSAPATAKVVANVVRGVQSPRVLDLGGGHGGYAAAIKADVPSARVTLFDRPWVLPIARKIAGDGFELLGGEFSADPLGGPYDAVLLSNIVHGEGEAGCARLFRRLREVVVPGGSVVIKDMFVDASGSAPEHAVDFGLSMLLMTDNGKSWRADELGGLLREAGFAEWRAVEMPSEGYGFVIAA
jgi:hypothetical protein